MKTQHTPGEWNIYQTEKGYSIESTSKSGSLIPIAQVHRFYANAKTNAKLMAAAPEMLEALKDIRAWYENNHEKYFGTYTPVCFSKGLSAIKKAAE